MVACLSAVPSFLARRLVYVSIVRHEANSSMRLNEQQYDMKQSSVVGVMREKTRDLANG